jgi:hypothetical protein
LRNFAFKFCVFHKIRFCEYMRFFQERQHDWRKGLKPSRRETAASFCRNIG